DVWYDWACDEIGDQIMERVAKLDAKTTSPNYLAETGMTREQVLEKVRVHLINFGVVLDHIFMEYQLDELGFSEEQKRAFLIKPPPQVDNAPTQPPKTSQSEVEYTGPQTKP